MKRILICLLAMLLLASLACTKPETPAPQESAAPQGGEAVPDNPNAETPPPPPEEPDYDPLPEELTPLEERIRGDWYADYMGLTVRLTVGEDGTYVISIPGLEGQDQSGAWTLTGSDLILNGEEGDPLLVMDEVISWASEGMFFRREQPIVYTPADVIPDAKEGAFDGYWKVQFVSMGDATILADALGEDTEVYIEGANVTLGGSLFGGIIRTFTYAAGALTLEENGMLLTVQLQQDGFLRLTIAGDMNMTLYLMPSVAPDTEQNNQ